MDLFEDVPEGFSEIRLASLAEYRVEFFSTDHHADKTQGFFAALVDELGERYEEIFTDFG